jgi:HD-GYP domain-containing protein (c-di-GMP phosphodiesterase class II)
MKKIKTSTLKPGMRFSKTVYIDEDTVLLQPEIPLKQREIDLLARWGIDQVMTDGESIGDAGAESGGGPLPERRSLRMYVGALSQMEKIFDGIRAGTRVSHDPIDAMVAEIIAAVETDRESLIRYVVLGGQSTNKLSTSSVNSAILATILGKSMKLLSFKLVQLTTGALLHDVGMLKVDETIRDKRGALTPDEIRQVRTHPLQGYSLVLKVLRYPEDVAAIALLHQERWDGRGYPRRLRGEEIPLGARIVAVADSFEAMVNRRSYRDPVIGYKAIKSILSDNGRHFDPQVLKSFLASVGIHPVGGLVLLNDASVGRVVANNPQSPLRPRLELLVDSSGQKLGEPVPLDLLEQRELFIAKPIEPHEMESR